MESQLKERLNAALHEFRREKFLRQNARLSIVNAASDSSSVPMRKFFLVNGASNYRPPLERSKSAPKLGSIEELSEEDEPERNGDGDGSRSLAEQVSGVQNPLDDLLSRLSVLPGEERVSVSSSSLSESHVAVVYGHVEEDQLIGSDSNTTATSTSKLYFSSPGPPLDPNSDPTSDSHCMERLSNGPLCLEVSTCGRDESLTSDHAESLESHSCSSSCNEDTEDDLLMRVVQATETRHKEEAGNQSVASKEKEDEDNISEESGYSEDKDLLSPVIKV